MTVPAWLKFDGSGVWLPTTLTIKIGELHEDEANFAFDRLLDIDKGVLTREAAQAAVSDAFSRMAASRAQNEAETGAKSAQ